MQYLIWWLSQEDCEALQNSLLYVETIDAAGDVEDRRIDGLPTYIDSEFWSRDGRAGRSRLWVSPTLTDLPTPFAIDWREDRAGARKCTFADYGGIVIRAEDKPAVLWLPGFVTDLDLRIVGE